MFWLIRVPTTSKHISKNKGATMKASRKNSLWQSFGQTGNFVRINDGTIKKWYKP